MIKEPPVMKSLHALVFALIVAGGLLFLSSQISVAAWIISDHWHQDSFKALFQASIEDLFAGFLIVNIATGIGALCVMAVLILIFAWVAPPNYTGGLSGGGRK